MVEQRIYIPYATDNWLVWVRLPPGVPSFEIDDEMSPLYSSALFLSMTHQ